MGKHSSKTRPNRGMKFLKTPKGLVLIMLLVLAAIAVAPHMDTKSIVNVAAGVLTGLAVDLLVGVFYKRKRFVSDGGLITGLIVAMVVSSFTPWYYTAATTAIALASKHILRVKRKPIFNPAAVGLLIAIYAFASIQSWWGGMSLLSGWYLIPLVIAGAFVTRRVKKTPQVIAYLATYFLVCGVLALLKQPNASYALQVPFVNSAVYMAFFMLTDPPTSPPKARDQIWFGAVSAGVSVAIYMLFGGLTYLLIGLLVANTLKFLQSQFMGRRVVQKSQTSVAGAK